MIVEKFSTWGVAADLFSSRRLKNVENEKIFLCMKIAEINMRVNLGSKTTILDIKTHFLELNSFSGSK